MKLNDLIKPAVEKMGYELTDIEIKTQDREQLVSIFIDNLTGINIEDCEIVSRQISLLLDVENPISGKYTLEVSSPGLDRKLTKFNHFKRFIGNELRIKLLRSMDGRRNFRGKLLAANKESIKVQVDDQLYKLPIDMIEIARLVPLI
ncbi:MAG: ribosome maturation factor RimP [Gammaproteobacteria bacterium]|uniref:Ribosome maturation factor RimP N-terminal domain-containing protein n=1 Tax=marine metagenome TaxID=408172 RepID=A0A381TLU3_9ZZZZ|nr:ribosome maturation factor RimP [Gammaproteobacteria bacterium]|tara:strand:+ start:275 stop:715 length:441 start_codon:yes stop_codon:yes gene_type:complete